MQTTNKTTKEFINLDTEIKNLKGRSYTMSFPTKDDLKDIRERLGKDEITDDDMPRETARNVIINSLTVYKVSDAKDSFKVNHIGEWANREKPEKLEPLYEKFLLDKVLKDAILKTEIVNENGKDKEVDKGLYYSWVITQVLRLFGRTE